MSASTEAVINLDTPPTSPREEDEKKKLTIRTSGVSKTVRKLELDYEPEKPCGALRDEVATRLGVPDQLRPLLVLKQSDAPTVLSGRDTDSLIRALNVGVHKNGDGEYKPYYGRDTIEVKMYERADGTPMLLKPNQVKIRMLPRISRRATTSRCCRTRRSRDVWRVPSHQRGGRRPRQRPLDPGDGQHHRRRAAGALRGRVRRAGGTPVLLLPLARQVAGARSTGPCEEVQALTTRRPF